MLVPSSRAATATRDALLIVLAGSGALLGGALVSQHAFGLYPCQMCLWQRWPHGAALVVATIGIGVMHRAAGLARVLAVLAALLVAVSGAIGLWHAGIEYGWWPGLSSCAAGGDAASAGGLDTILSRSVVRCDAAPWTLAGVSLAGYTGVLSLAIAGVALLRWRTGVATGPRS